MGHFIHPRPNRTEEDVIISSERISAETKFCALKTNAGLTSVLRGLISIEFSSLVRFGSGVVGVESSGPINRIRPLNLRVSDDPPPFGSLPNHSSSSVREDVIEWSVNSANLRLRGVFQSPSWEGDEVIGGVGTRGRGATTGSAVGSGGGYNRAGVSLIYH